MATDATLIELKKRRRDHLIWLGVCKVIAFTFFALAVGRVAGGDTGFWFYFDCVFSLAVMVIGMAHDFKAGQLERKINGF